MSIRIIPQLLPQHFYEMEALELKPLGMNIGGNYYMSAHQRMAYLRKDPCSDCLCPKDLCQTPCQLRRTWDAAREEWPL